MGMSLEALFDNGVSVGEVAGFISGALSMIHLTLPLFLAVILIAVVQDEKHNAATWSVISSQLQNSLWPVLLQADTSKTRHVRWRVTVISWLVVFGTFAAVVASFLTPQPLTGGSVPESSLSVVDFQYTRDTSYFGLGTPPRVAGSVNRLCGYSEWKNCPESQYLDADGNPVFWWNETYWYGTEYESILVNFTVVNSTLPQQLVDRYSSGMVNTTIAKPTDIQYRNYHITHSGYLDKDEPIVYGGFEPLQTLMLDGSYRIVEGAVVDTIDGGIGFRNHTVPVGLPLGATWTEDLLFVTPETSCVNSNLSLHFAIDPYVWFNHTDGHLVDDGGLANLAPDPPQPSWSDDNGDAWAQTDGVPDLQGRAYTAAWWNNYWTAYVLGAKDSQVGASYYTGASWWNRTVSNSAIKISNMNGWYLDELGNDPLYAGDNIFTAYGRRCSGFNDSMAADSNKPFIRCGYLYGIPSPVEEGQSWYVDPGTKWRIPLYTCASSMKASVKQVKFVVNGTSVTNNSLSLDSLTVASVEDKVYANQSSQPLWAVEKPKDGVYAIRDINLFWGMVDEAHRNDSIMTVTQAPELYLPAVGFYNSLGYDSDGFAAGSMGIAWSAVYANSAPGINVDENNHFQIPNYSGSENFGLALKYRELSRTAEGAAQILNLIWTDLATWSFVGTNTGFEADQAIANSPTTQTSSLGTRAVFKYRRAVSYKDFRYAVPAFVTGLIWFAAFLTTILLFAFRIVHWATLNHYVNQTTMGRAFTNVSHPGVADPTAKSRKWHDTAGKLILNVPDSKARHLTRIRGSQYSKIGARTEFTDSDVELLQRGLSGQTMMTPEAYSPYFEQRRFSTGGSGGVGPNLGAVPVFAPSPMVGPSLFGSPRSRVSSIGTTGIPSAPSTPATLMHSIGRKISRRPIPSASYSAIPSNAAYSEIRPYGSSPFVKEVDLGTGEGDYSLPAYPERRPGYHREDTNYYR